MIALITHTSLFLRGRVRLRQGLNSVAHAGLEVVVSLLPQTWSSGITGMSHLLQSALDFTLLHQKVLSHLPSAHAYPVYPEVPLRSLSPHPISEQLTHLSKRPN